MPDSMPPSRYWIYRLIDSPAPRAGSRSGVVRASSDLDARHRLGIALGATLPAPCTVSVEWTHVLRTEGPVWQTAAPVLETLKVPRIPAPGTTVTLARVPKFMDDAGEDAPDIGTALVIEGPADDAVAEFFDFNARRPSDNTLWHVALRDLVGY